MRQAKCGTCGTQLPSDKMVLSDETVLCNACADSQAREAAAAGRKMEFHRVVDPTICSGCSTDYGSGDLQVIGGRPICPNCKQSLYERPFPAWLKSSLAGVLLLLAVALWHGIGYFKAGRHLVIAERAMDQGDYGSAQKHFAEVLKATPTEQKVVLLGAKANLMSGDIAGAQEFLKQRDEFEQTDLFSEVNGLWSKALDAYKKAEQAAKLDDAEHIEQAAALMAEASQEYPQSSALAVGAIVYQSSVAFYRKDYDALLRLANAALEKTPQNPGAISRVASALACKYATTGNVEYLHQAEALLEKAGPLSRGSPEDKAAFEEYSERIRYRLKTREIIDKPEYDRRFRKGEGKS